ncbi:hypothetical protein EC960939_0330, partial [Escherichia coli 96.0939]
FATS